MSPIPGLTDRQPSFKEIGRLRKGAAKSAGLKDLTYFRADFRPDESEAAAMFRSVYGDEPVSIRVRLAFNEIDRCWDANYRVYNKAGMLGQAGGIPGMGDGLYWHYLRHNSTGEIIVKDNRTKSGELMPFDPKTPIYSYKSKKGDDVAVYAKPEGRLKLMIPELQRANYLLLLTHSIYDVMSISEELKGIAVLAANVGYPLSMVRLLLSRRWDTVSCTINGGNKHMEQRNLVHVDMDPGWAAPHFALLDAIQPGKALPAPAAIEFSLPALPANVLDDDETEMYGADDPATEEPIAARSMQAAPKPAGPKPAAPAGQAAWPTKPPTTGGDMTWCEWCGDRPAAPGQPCDSCQQLGARPDNRPDRKTTTARPAAPQPAAPQPASATPPTNGNARPYSPEQVAEKLRKLAQAFVDNAWTLKPSDRNMLPVNLEACFAGDPDSKDRRHTVIFWLFDATSTKELTDAQVYALKKWLDAAPDEGGQWMPNGFSVREAQAIYAEALRAQGQLELPLGAATQAANGNLPF